jgi:copper chaperone
MQEFKLPAMSCGHCVAAVTGAVKNVDPAAKVEVDLDQKNARIESSQDRAVLAAALTEAGYPPA